MRKFGKNRSEASGKGLALRVDPRGLCTNVATDKGDCGESYGPSRQSFGGVEDESFWALVLSQ